MLLFSSIFGIFLVYCSKRHREWLGVLLVTPTITTPGNDILLGILGIFAQESWGNSPEIRPKSSRWAQFLTEIPVRIGWRHATCAASLAGLLVPKHEHSFISSFQNLGKSRALAIGGISQIFPKFRNWGKMTCMLKPSGNQRFSGTSVAGACLGQKPCSPLRPPVFDS